MVRSAITESALEETKDFVGLTRDVSRLKVRITPRSLQELETESWC